MTTIRRETGPRFQPPTSTYRRAAYAPLEAPPGKGAATPSPADQPAT